MFENFFSRKTEEAPKGPNTLLPEHLKEGVSPIIACVGTSEDFAKDETGMTGLWGKPDPERTENVAFFTRRAEETTPGQKRGEERLSYVFSGMNGLDKLSRSFRDCTGVVAAIDKDTGEEISFLSHEAPKYLAGSSEQRGKYELDLRARLEDLRARSVPGTIDAVVVGGKYIADRSIRKDYEADIALLSKNISSVLGFEPVVIVGPKVVESNGVDEDRVFYRTKGRRLFVMRPWEEDVAEESYLPHDMETKREEWKKANRDAALSDEK